MADPLGYGINVCFTCISFNRDLPSTCFARLRVVCPSSERSYDVLLDIFVGDCDLFGFAGFFGVALPRKGVACRNVRIGSCTSALPRPSRVPDGPRRVCDKKTRLE
ncbi:hypothetical protein IG631_21455 [Alternaria alternata]|nr:hypothetical protein IG631_21455 [Alternaria alternata]